MISWLSVIFLMILINHDMPLNLCTGSFYIVVETLASPLSERLELDSI